MRSMTPSRSLAQPEPKSRQRPSRVIIYPLIRRSVTSDNTPWYLRQENHEQNARSPSMTHDVVTSSTRESSEDRKWYTARAARIMSTVKGRSLQDATLAIVYARYNCAPATMPRSSVPCYGCNSVAARTSPQANIRFKKSTEFPS